MQTALPTFNALDDAVPGATVIRDCREEVVLAGLLAHCGASEVLQRFARHRDAAMQVVESGANAVKQDSPAELVGFHRG